jgi:hypothetical protein
MAQRLGGRGWSSAERRVLARLTSPWKVQEFLDGVPYSTEPVYRSPRSVLRDRVAHCVDGGLFAAAALRRMGHRPRVVWIHAWNDDGHLFAVFREGRRWGAVAKSNVVNLRYRPAVYASLRELMMSCFNDYFNTLGERSMRGYTRPLDLSRFDRTNWETDDAALPAIVDGALDRQPVVRVLTARRARALEPVDARTLAAGLMGARPEGLYAPERGVLED